MASVDKVPTGYRVRWRTPDGKSRSKTIKREVDAKRFLVRVEYSKDAGTYMDPSRSKITVKAWAAQWLSGQTHLKPSTRARYKGIVDAHIVPRWGGTSLFQVSHADVQKWVSSIDLAPATVRYVHRVFSLLLELAVRDKRIRRTLQPGYASRGSRSQTSVSYPLRSCTAWPTLQRNIRSPRSAPNTGL
jgi:Phage integrase, N-terminal SAM-like domain